MSDLKDIQNELQAKIEAVKKINDDPLASLSQKLADKYTNNQPDTKNIYGQKLDSLSQKINSKIENKDDIFSSLLDVAKQFLNNFKQTQGYYTDVIKKGVPVNNYTNFSQDRLKKHAFDALKKTMSQSKDIVLKDITQSLFIGEGICGTQSIIPLSADTMTLRPNEFDLQDILTVDPNSNCGKLIYEPINPNLNKQKVNRNLYNSFGGTPYSFVSNNGNSLFTMTWDIVNQQYNVSGLTQGGSSVNAFNLVSDYYASTEFPDMNYVVKTAMMLTIQGGSSCSKKFNISLNSLMRVLQRLLKICGSPNNPQDLKNQTPNGLFNETDQDEEFYFDFDSVEGIDIDEEDARLRRVLRFKDCYNFEIPVSDTHVEDFVYLIKTKDPENAVSDILKKVALDASNQSGPTFNLSDFLNNLLNNFIISLPKALIMSLLSPKIFLPLVMMYKIFKGTFSDIKDLVKKLYKAISKIIKDLFWLFLREFWKLIKIDLLAFVAKLISKVLKNKYKRYITIITALISLLTQILESNIDNCFSLFQTILSTIKKSLSSGSPISIPSPLLALSGSLPGYSQDRAYMNIMERLSAAGVNTGPVFGEPNKLGSIVKSIIDGHTEEEDTNSFIKIVLNPTVLAGPPVAGGAVIPPASVSGVGKKI